MGSTYPLLTVVCPTILAGVIPDRESLLVQTAAGMRTRYRIDVRTGHEVLRIHRPEKEVEVLERETGKVYREGYDYLVLSPGAEPIRPDLPGIDAEGIFHFAHHGAYGQHY